MCSAWVQGGGVEGWLPRYLHPRRGVTNSSLPDLAPAFNAAFLALGTLAGGSRNPGPPEGRWLPQRPPGNERHVVFNCAPTGSGEDSPWKYLAGPSARVPSLPVQAIGPCTHDAKYGTDLSRAAVSRFHPTDTWS